MKVLRTGGRIRTAAVVLGRTEPNCERNLGILIQNILSFDKHIETKEQSMCYWRKNSIQVHEWR